MIIFNSEPKKTNTYIESLHQIAPYLNDQMFDIHQKTNML